MLFPPNSSVYVSLIVTCYLLYNNFVLTKPSDFSVLYFLILLPCKIRRITYIYSGCLENSILRRAGARQKKQKSLNKILRFLFYFNTFNISRIFFTKCCFHRKAVYMSHLLLRVIYYITTCLVIL